MSAMAKKTEAAVAEIPAEGDTPAEVFATEEATVQAKLDTAVTFLRWLANASKGDWDLRRRVVQCLKSIDAWDQ